MAMYAYEDAERKKEIKPKEAAKKDRNIQYYCPNEDCPAKMYIWGVNGEKTAYFRSLGEPGHVENCFGGSKNSFNPNKTNVDEFEFDSAVDRMMNSSKSKKKRNQRKSGMDYVRGETKEIIPHTIRQVYDMCKAYSCRDEINNQKVGYILYDERSAYMYPKGIYGKKLIEAKCKKFFYDRRSIFLETPISEVKYELELRVENEKIFKQLKNMIFNNREYIIVVVGNWQPSGTWNRFVTEFHSMKQIKILRSKYKK